MEVGGRISDSVAEEEDLEKMLGHFVDGEGGRDVNENWEEHSDLMKEIGQFRGSCHGLLKKIVCDDRSKPILSKDLTKIKGVVSIANTDKNPLENPSLEEFSHKYLFVGYNEGFNSLLFQFVYESEKHSKDADILKEINKGIKLNHVKCNDRSKPNLKGRFPHQ